MNVSSIYQASHILGMQPSQRTQEAAEMRGVRDNDRDRDDASVSAMRSVSAGSVNLKGQQLGQVLNASA